MTLTVTVAAEDGEVEKKERHPKTWLRDDRCEHSSSGYPQFLLYAINESFFIKKKSQFYISVNIMALFMIKYNYFFNINAY